MINATKEYFVPGISAEAYFAMYADEDGMITLPDTEIFAEPKEDVSFNDECIFLEGRLYNTTVENGIYSIYCTGREDRKPVFYGMINISNEMFDQYFRLEQTE